MMSSDTKPYHNHAHNATMEAESSSLVHPLSTPYQDSFNENRSVRTHRAHSWGSEDTLGHIYDVRSQVPAISKAQQNEHADLDLEFLGVGASYEFRTRQRPWIIFIVVVSAVLV